MRECYFLHVRFCWMALLLVVILFGNCTLEAEPSDKPLPPEQVYLDFSKDPNWEGRNNLPEKGKTRTTIQDFGWSKTNHTQTGSAGEIGGYVSRSLTPAWYAKVLDKPLTLNDKISASGVLSLTQDDGGSGALLGFFNHTSRGWRTPNSLVFRIDGNGGKAWVFYEYGTHNWETGCNGCFEGKRYQTTPTKPMPADGKPHIWSLEYDPAGGNGLGQITFTLDGKVYELVLTKGHKTDGATFDRFGIFNQQSSGGGMTIWFSNLVINGEKQNLSSDPRWEGSGNRVKFEDLAERPIHNFGYSANTSYAGGKSGEIGGLVWRADHNTPEECAYYSMPVGPLTMDKELHASGRIAFVGAASDSGVLFGWFNSKTPFGIPGNNTIAVYMEGPSRIGHYFRPAFCDANGNRAILQEGSVIKPNSEQHEWTLHYDPQANNGTGRITVTLDGKPAVLDLKTGQKQATFDRFGIATLWSGGHHVLFYLDDITFTAK